MLKIFCRHLLNVLLLKIRGKNKLKKKILPRGKNEREKGGLERAREREGEREREREKKNCL